MYGKKPKRLNQHRKKIKKIRKKKKANKKKALSAQFKYASKLLQHNQKKVGLKSFNTYTKQRKAALKRMKPEQVNRMYNATKMGLDKNTYSDFSNIYKNMFELDWMNKQQQQYKNFNTQHREITHYNQEKKDNSEFEFNHPVGWF